MNGFNRKTEIRPNEREPSSIVLLLQSSQFPNLTQLSACAEKAFHVPFATENTTNYCVFQKVLFTLLRAGPHVLSFMFYTKPYFQDDPNFVRDLRLPAQRAACEKHSAWLAMNYARGPANEDVQYALLSKLSIAMLNSDCTGAYFPGKHALIPNDGSLLLALEKKVSSVGDLRLPPLTRD